MSTQKHDLNAPVRPDPPAGEPRYWLHPLPDDALVAPRPMLNAAHWRDEHLPPIPAPRRGLAETLLFAVCGVGLITCVGLAVWLAFEQARVCGL